MSKELTEKQQDCYRKLLHDIETILVSLEKDWFKRATYNTFLVDRIDELVKTFLE